MQEDTFADDAILVRHVLGGETGKFDRLVDRYFGKIFAVAYANLADKDAAEDLAQEVFLRAYLHLNTLKEPRAFLAWAVRITRNLASAWRRNAQTASRLLPMLSIEDMEMEPRDWHGRSPRETASEREQERLLAEAIMRLEPSLREIVLLQYTEGLSLSDIARTLGTNKSSVNRRLLRAVSQLRSDVGTPSQAAAKSLGHSTGAAVRAGAAVLAASTLSANARAALLAASADTTALAGAVSVGSGGATVVLKTAVGSLLGLKGAAVTVAIVLAGISGYYYTSAHRLSQGKPGRHVAASSANHSASENPDPRVSRMTPDAPRAASSTPVARRTSRAAGEDRSQRGTIQGRVVDDANTPVSGVHVLTYVPSDDEPWGLGKLVPQDESNATFVMTDQHGAFLVRNVPPGIVTLDAQMNGYHADPLQLRLAATRTTEGVELVLRRKVDLLGEVIDAATSKPIAGVRVSVSDVGKASANSGRDETDAQGRFSVSVALKRILQFRASHPDYAIYKGELAPVPNGRVQIAINRRKEILLIGDVLDAFSRSPIPEYTVDCETQGDRGTTPTYEIRYAPGRFTLSGLREDDIGGDITVRARGYGGATSQKIFLVSQAGPEVHETFLMYPLVKVRGRVVTSPDNQPVPGARVTIKNSSTRNAPSEAAVTDAQGHFACDVAGARGNFCTVRVTVPATENSALRQVLIPDAPEPDIGDIAIGSGSVRVYGTVVRMPGEVPVPNETIRFRGFHQRRQTVTDANGAFEFKDLPNNEDQRFSWSLDLQNGMVCPVREFGQPDMNGDLLVVIRLGGTRLRGTVTQAGAPVRCSASAILAKGTVVNGQASADGTFTLESLPAGPARLMLSPSDASGETHIYEIEVPSVPEFEKSFVIPGGSISGAVLDADGKPLSDHLIMASPGGEESRNPTRHSKSGADGGYRLQRLKTGRYTVTAFTIAHKHAVAECDVTDIGEMRLDIRFPAEPAILVSQVYGYQDGEPRPYARLTIRATNGALIENSNVRTPSGEMRAELTPGTYDVSVSEPGFTSAQHRVTLAAGETKVLRDVLQHVGYVALTVQHKDGKPAAGVSMRLVPVDASIQEPVAGRSDDQGIWKPSGVLPGHYRIEAKVPTGQPVIQDLQVVPHETTEAVIGLP